MRLALWTALRGLRARAGALAITVLAVALATATALTVPLVTRQVERGAQDAAQVFDLLIAAPGSATQALTSSLFYLDTPTGNISEKLYEELRDSPGTRRAVPIALGDNHLGFPIVGTNAAFFDQRLKPKDPPYFRIAQGQIFAGEHQIVAGARTAREGNLKLGSTFKGAHGLEEQEAEAGGGDARHDEAYTVVGILAATGGPVDRALLTPVETVWGVHGQNSPEQRQVTAVLYAADQLAGIYVTAQKINAGKEAMAVFPGQVFAGARDVLAQGQAAYAGLSLLVLGIAALAVWLGVHSATVERQRTVALLRALGAGRITVFGLVLGETLITVTLGVALGLALALLVSGIGGTLLGERLGFTLAPPRLTWPLAVRGLALIPLGLLAALPPAIGAVRVSPLRHL